MTSPPKHILKAYDAELNELRAMISQMGGLAQSQLDDSISALMTSDALRAQEIILADKSIDNLEIEVDRLAVQTIALRAPLGDDLREIICALKISSILERIGDYGKNIAKRTTVLAQSDLEPDMAILPQMSRIASGMIQNVLDSFVTRDADLAAAVRERDIQVDRLYNALFRELLTHMMESPRTITPATHLLFIAKNIERIGDHATNAAEMVYYSVTGQTLETAREKVDSTPYETLKDVTPSNPTSEPDT